MVSRIPVARWWVFILDELLYYSNSSNNNIYDLIVR